MPTLLEWARTPASVSRSVGCGSASWNGKPWTRICSGTVYGVIGVWPCSSAAAAVITLAVLPGGKIEELGMSTVDATLVTLVGVNVGYCAMARILPVLGSSTTTMQLSALFAFT